MLSRLDLTVLHPTANRIRAVPTIAVAGVAAVATRVRSLRRPPSSRTQPKLLALHHQPRLQSLQPQSRLNRHRRLPMNCERVLLLHPVRFIITFISEFDCITVFQSHIAFSMPIFHTLAVSIHPKWWSHDDGRPAPAADPPRERTPPRLAYTRSPAAPVADPTKDGKMTWL